MRPRRASRRSPWRSIAFVAFAAIIAAASADDDGSPRSIPVSLATRDAVATRADTYTYTSVAMPDDDHYIHRFEPRASAKVVHHMLLFGCKGAASPTLRTREGGMFSENSGGGQPRGAVCAGSDPEPFIFGWGKDAPDLHLPDGIGFRVGGDFGFKTLVLETHYLEKFAPKKTNLENGTLANDANEEEDPMSGVTVHLRPGVPRRFMSVLAYAQGFVLPPNERRTEVKTVCAYTDSAPLSAYAFRVHTHALGVEVFLEKAVAGSGFENKRLTDTSREKDRAKPFRPKPIKLASRDPQLPQLFEVVASGETEKEGSTSFDIAPGDALRVTCVFDTSNRTAVTRAGWGHGDEMCNLYLMVHAEEPRYASCTGSASGGGGRSKFDFESRVEKTKTTPVAAAATGAFVVPPPKLDALSGRRDRAFDPDSSVTDSSWPLSVGQVSGVAFEPDGRHVWVFHRGSRVWRGGSFDENFSITETKPIAEHTIARICLTTGRIVKKFGANEHYMPHGLTLAPNGDVWVTDVGAHVVIRYDARDGSRLATFGSNENVLRKRLAPTRRAIGDFSANADPSGFCAPTDVAVAQDGSFWVSDGYCNDRVARFDANGAFVDEWGAARGANDASRESAVNASANDASKRGFDVPHSIALDFRRARLVVADRERARVTEHALDGTMLESHDFKEHGYVYHVATLSAEDDGMSGFYALTWSRGDSKFSSGSSSGVRLLAAWDDGGAGSKKTRRYARWDLPFAKVPHAIDVVGGGVGGTRAWGRGVSLFVTETGDRDAGDASLHRVWLGERFDARSDTVAPARGWTYEAEPALYDEAAEAAERNSNVDAKTAFADPPLVVAAAERPSEENFGREERLAVATDGDASKRAFDDEDEDEDYAFDAEARIAAPQHGGGFGGFRPGGAVEARDSRESNLRLMREGRASRLYALWGAGTLFAAALAFATYPRRGKAGWGRVLEGRRDSRAREESRRVGVEMT
jgi:peptidylamidoglycolate lyase